MALVEEGWGWLVRQGYASGWTARPIFRNVFVASLPQREELMGGRPIGWASGGACPRRTEWATRLEATGVWAYSQARLNSSVEAAAKALEESAAEPVDASMVLNALRLAGKALALVQLYLLGRLADMLKQLIDGERFLVICLALGAGGLLVTLRRAERAEAERARASRRLKSV